MKKIWIWILSLVGVLVIVGVIGFVVMKGMANMAGGAKEEEVTVQKVVEKELIETILVTGKVVPENEQKVFLDAEKGDIKEYKVKENQEVKAGDPLIVYDSSKLQVELNQAVRERDLIKKRAKTEEKQINEMNKQIATAKKNAEEEGATELQKEKTEMEIQHESTKSEITSLQEQINELNDQMKKMTVVSKLDGTVVKVEKNVVASDSGLSEPIIHIVSSKPYKIIGTMSEFDSVKVKKDQSVLIRPKVYKDREWKGKVESVSKIPSEQGDTEELGGGGNVTMYPFKVALTDDTKDLRQGFHVSLEIKIDGDGKSLVVPHTALVDNEDEKVVFVVKDHVLEERKVEIGQMNDEYLEIKQGIKKGELVVVSPTEMMHDGMEVTSIDEVK